MARKKRDEEEIEIVRQLLPLNPPEAPFETIKQRQKAAKLVYRCAYCREALTGLKRKVALAHCTSCGGSYYLNYAIGGKGCHAGGYGDSFGFWDPLDNEAKFTGSTCICPECGAEAEGLHISHIRGTYPIEKSYFMTVHNIRGHFVALSWVLFKECNKEGEISYTVRRYEGSAIIGGLPIRYTGYQNGFYGHWSDQWDTRAVWKDNGDEWDAEEIFMNREDFEASSAAKSGLEEYIENEQKKIRIGAYLQLWTKDPQIENLVRSGLSSYLRQVIEKASYVTGYYGTGRAFSTAEAEKYFDRKKVKPHEMLGIEKAELPLAKKWSVERLDFYKQVLKFAKIRLTGKQLKAIEGFGRGEFRKMLEEAKEELGHETPIVRTLNYLQKQRQAHGNVVTAQYLLDYWNMTKEIQGGLPPELLYPKDLKRAHDLAVMRKKEKVDNKVNAKIVEYAKTLFWLSWEDKETGLFIRAAGSQEELIKEGRFLSHCVGTYAGAVSRHETAILFIRHIDDPEIPFFTLEYKNGKVIQNRGKSNCSRTPEVAEFEAKWLRHINELKEVSINGKRNGNQTAAGKRASA